MIELNDFPKHVQTIQLKDWDGLFALIPKIESTIKFGEVKGGEKLKDGSTTAPYWHSSEVIDSFVRIFYDLNICVVFNWGSWDAGKTMLMSKDADYSTLDTITLCKLLTTIVREDRFNDGFLISCFENRTLIKILKALQQNIKIKNTKDETN